MTSNLISILYNTTDYVVRARLPLIAALKRAGYDVVVLSPVDQATPALQEHGIDHIPIEMSQYGMNPIDEWRGIGRLTRIFRDLDPLVSLHYTVKPNTFGAIAARRAGVPVISNIAGAGRAFSGGNPVMRKIVTGLYRRGLRDVDTIFFQNGDDMRIFEEEGLVRREQCRRIPGSGVDVGTFVASPLPPAPDRFLFVGRLLKEKGIDEFLTAASALSAALPAGQRPRFDIVGEHDTSRHCIDGARLAELTAPDNVVYHGTVPSHEIRDLMRAASCVVLPSYYGEGVPRVLLEACASGRPIITTDNVGCRDVIEDGVNGLQVPVRDATALKEAMRSFVDMGDDAKQRMAKAARLTAETRFDERFVIDAYLDAVNAIRDSASDTTA